MNSAWAQTEHLGLFFCKNVCLYLKFSIKGLTLRETKRIEMTINGKVETEGDRFAELLGMEWRKQVEAAAALGVHQGTISSLVKAEEISKTRLNKYAPILREHNLNPEYVKNPFAPRRLTADSSLDITEVKRQIEGLKQQLSALEQSVGG